MTGFLPYKAYAGTHDRIDRCARSKLRKIYAVSWDGKEYFPAYQFSEAVQPLPVMAEVLAQFGEVADSWQISAWSHFPNGWLAAAGPGEAQRARAPRDCLEEREALLQAVRHRLGSYQA